MIYYKISFIENSVDGGLFNPNSNVLALPIAHYILLRVHDMDIQSTNETKD